MVTKTRLQRVLAGLFLLPRIPIVFSAAPTFQPLGIPFNSPVTVATGFQAHVLFSNLTLPRGITFDSHQNLLVAEHGAGITAFTPVLNGSDGPGWERSIVISGPNFTQGIQVDGETLYVSTPSQALAYKYNPITKTTSGDGVVIVDGLPADGDLITHTLQLEQTPNGKSILIASGPLTNIDVTARDPTSGRSQIRRFLLTQPTPQPWLSGELIAFGIRNPAGFAFTPLADLAASQLWVVENGASIDNVTGLTVGFVNDNPADELDFVQLSPAAATLGRSYGFPDCTTLWNGSADPVGVPEFVGVKRGTQFSLRLEPERNDTWCRDETNNIPPVLSFQAHSVPLDIKFYVPRIDSGDGAFHRKFTNDAFVSFHGSFNRVPPTGYGIIRIPFTDNLHFRPSSQNYEYIIQATDITSCPGPDLEGRKCIRPVGVAFGLDGRLYASSDSSGEIFVIESD